MFGLPTGGHMTMGCQWRAGGTVTLTGPGSDLDDDEATPGTVNIAAGTLEATFTIDTREDAEVEADETFAVTISAADTLPVGGIATPEVRQRA